MAAAHGEPLSEDDLALLSEVKAKPKPKPKRPAWRICSLHKHIRSLEKKLALYEEERRLERIRRFGASADRGEHQYRLFNEAEAHEHDAADDDASGATDQVAVAAHTKRKAKRKPLPQDLPRVVVDHELTADQRYCECGGELTAIGVQTSEQLAVIPAQAYVIEHRRHSYRCGCCDAPPVAAPLPAQPFPKSIASPGLFTHLPTAKTDDDIAALLPWRLSKDDLKPMLHVPVVSTT